MVRKEFLEKATHDEKAELPAQVENKEEEQPRIYMKPVCVSQEEMFNIINDKLDNMIALLSQLRIVEEKKK